MKLHGIHSLVHCRRFGSTCLPSVQPQHCAQTSVTVQYQTFCKINDIKHHVTKTSAEMEVNLHAVLNLAVEKSEESASRCGRFTSDKHYITGTTGPTAALDRKPDAIPGRSAHNVGTCNTERAIPALTRTRCVQWQNFLSFPRRLF